MKEIEYSTSFKKDYKSLTQEQKNSFIDAIAILKEGGTLPFVPYRTHKLTGNFKDCSEAHIEPDLLLIWHNVDNETIALLRIGSHSKLFGKKKGAK